MFGWCHGAFPQYVAAPEKALAIKPATLTVEETAAVPTSGFTALQALRNAGHVQPGCDVLIVGASGGVGTFAVQLAAAFDAQVTGVCSARNTSLVGKTSSD